MLEYKLKLYGISLKKQEESYSSQCSPWSEEVSAVYACKNNRVQRGLYRDGSNVLNADVVGAFNILRKYTAISGNRVDMPVSGLRKVTMIKVAV
jgi:putative transposase